jgi:hypothetical protein
MTIEESPETQYFGPIGEVASTRARDDARRVIRPHSRPNRRN